MSVARPVSRVQQDARFRLLHPLRSLSVETVYLRRLEVLPGLRRKWVLSLDSRPYLTRLCPQQQDAPFLIPQLVHRRLHRTPAVRMMLWPLLLPNEGCLQVLKRRAPPGPCLRLPLYPMPGVFSSLRPLIRRSQRARFPSSFCDKGRLSWYFVPLCARRRVSYSSEVPHPSLLHLSTMLWLPPL